MAGRLPRISIVTPSFNQGEFLEETILSVINQNYPNLEYIIMDGGSTDNSIEIIKKYRDKISHWVSESDNGQADAINRGFSMATGDILAYINSDDIYLPGSFEAIAEAFMSNSSVSWVVGNGYCIDDKGRFLARKRYAPITFINMLFLEDCVMQPTAFWKKELYFSVGGIDTKYHFSFDYDLFLKFVERSRPVRVRHDIAAFRMHPLSKTSTIHDICLKEDQEIHMKYFMKGNNPFRYLACRIFDQVYRRYYFLSKRYI